jgi:kynurenine formamidase
MMYIDLSLPVSPDGAAPETTARERSLMDFGHKGTHLDRLLGTTLPPDYVKSRAVQFPVDGFSANRPVTPEDIPLDRIRGGDFVLFHTGAVKRHRYGSRAYLDAYFELSWEVIDALIDKKIHFIGIDARGIRANREHREADERCERARVYVIENLQNTELLPALEPFVLYAFCFDTGGSGLPCRVIAEVP